ncbi:MAG: phosphonopyruvate decarboxylase [Alphaproteobacteria bacterium]|nr:phosphonopyruvate decarboxylase [Alphaproteobacteria bacterium]
MITADQFLAAAHAQRLDFYTGVPCSFLTPLINGTISNANTSYVGATSEGEAVAIAAGAWLAGRNPVVMCQNSGLGNAINPLTSLNHPFRIPTLLIATWRGQPGLKDEPQHELMGEITAALFDTMRIPHAPFPTDETDLASSLGVAAASMAETQLPYALIMAKGSVRDDGLDAPVLEKSPRGTRLDMQTGAPLQARTAALQCILASLPAQAAVIATTGKCGRELFTLADRRQHLYQVGSMGCASAMGLGVAINTQRPVVVLDGDGAALMKMGNMATIGAQAPANLIHVVLDNGAHDSTGGQATVSANVDFADLGLACGYRSGAICDEMGGLGNALTYALAEPGPHLVHVRIAPGSPENLGRPTVKPADVARRFKAFLADADI